MFTSEQVQEARRVHISALEELEEKDEFGHEEIDELGRRAIEGIEAPAAGSPFFETVSNLNITEPHPHSQGVASAAKKIVLDPRPEMELMDLYTKWDANTHKKGKEALQEGQDYYKKLEHLKNIWQKIQGMLDDLPEEYTFPIEIEEAFQVAEEMGLVEEGKRTFSKKDLKVLNATINAEMEILPQKANIAFGRVTKLLDLSNLVLKVVGEALKDNKSLIERINGRARAG